MYIYIFISSPSLAACDHLSPRIAIVLSILYNAPTSPCHSRLFYSYFPPTQCVPLGKVGILPLCGFYFRLRCHRVSLCVFFLLPTTGSPLSSCWHVLVPYTKMHLHHFRVAQWAVQLRFHSYHFCCPPVFP